MGVISAVDVCGQIAELFYMALAKFLYFDTQLNTKSNI